MSEAHVWLCQPSRPHPSQELWSSKPSKSRWVALYTNQKAFFQRSVWQLSVQNWGCRENHLWAQAVLHTQHQSPANISNLLLEPIAQHLRPAPVPELMYRASNSPKGCCLCGC